MKLDNRSNTFTIKEAIKSIIPKSSNVSYENILDHYLDADTVPVEDYLDDNGWVTADRSDILTGDRSDNLISRFIVHLKLNNTIPRTEWSLELKLFRKVSERLRKDLRGIWETLAPGSTVVRTSPTITVVKEPGVPEVRVKNSDIAKIGTRAEPNTDLWQYAQRRLFRMIRRLRKRSLSTQKI